MLRLAQWIPFAAFSVAAFAQAPPDFHWCTLNGGGGYAFAVGKDGSNLSGQWTAGAGAGFAAVAPSVSSRWSLFINVDYFFARYQVNRGAIIQAGNLNPTDTGLLNATGGSTRFNVVALDPTVRYGLSKHFELYSFAGFGWFRRAVDLTGVSSQGSLLQPASPSVFLRNSTSGSVDGGAGVNWRPGRSPISIYFEARVVHGMAINHTATLIPIGIGIRY